MYDNCSSYTQSITSRYPDARVTTVNNVTVLVRGGPGTLQLPIDDLFTKQQGAAPRGLQGVGQKNPWLRSPRCSAM